MVKESNPPMESIRTVLELLLRTLPPESREEAALLAWPIVAGPAIQARTRAERLEGDILHIQVSDATWQRQLNAVRGDLIQALNQLLGEQRIGSLALHVAPLASSSPANMEQP
jgi:hypothetical protein